MGEKEYKIGSLNQIYDKSKLQSGETYFDKFKIGVTGKIVGAVYKQQQDREVLGAVRGVVVWVNEEINISDFNVFSDKEKSVNIHVKVPEVHGYLLDPFEFAYGTPEYENIAKSYPVFTGLTADKRPQWRDIVLVSFKNMNEKSAGGNYISTVSSIGGVASSAGFSAGAAASYKQGVVQRMSNKYIPQPHNPANYGNMSATAQKDGKEWVDPPPYLPSTTRNAYKYLRGYYKGGKTSFLSDFDPYLKKDQDDGKLPLSPENIKKIIFVISSRCSTSPTYVSTEDTLTIGWRRLAARGLKEILQVNYGWTIEEAIANDYKKALEISDTEKWFKIQYEDYMKSLRWNLKFHNFKMGREIVLWERCKNSVPALLEKTNPQTYEALRDFYVSAKQKENKGQERVARIEAFIGPDEVWR